MANILLKNFTKKFGDSIAVNNLNIEIKDKEFAVLVGPSGCGKTTTLRAIAGLEDVTSGEIFIDNKLVNDIHPKDRDIAMVFQNYALYPHMDVYNNMAFGLKLRKRPLKEIDKRTTDTASILGLGSYLLRKPNQLSGGQRQRVALGRAIVRQPKVFLFDEPLSNLDAKLRVIMRTEIIKLHRRLNTTMIYVTHDQVEAMTMASRIFIMNDGELQQSGPPLDIYYKPKNIFVASFIGSPAMNLLNVQIVKDNSDYFIDAECFRLKIPCSFNSKIAKYTGTNAVFGIRPEDIYDKKHSYEIVPDQLNTTEVKVDVIEPLGSEVIVYVNKGKHSLTCKIVIPVAILRRVRGCKYLLT